MDDYLDDLDYQKTMLERFRAKYRDLDEVQKPVHLYALLDQGGLTAVERQTCADLLERRRGVSLYAGSGLGDLEAIGPVLLAMPDLRGDELLTDADFLNANPDTDVFVQLLSLARDHAARVTWIWTPHRADTLVEHLQTLLHARLGTDGEDVWFFFYHPSHLKVLHKTLPEATRQYMFGPVHAWWMLDVHDRLIELTGEGSSVPRGWEVLPVPADVVEALQRAAMPMQVHAWLQQIRMNLTTGYRYNDQIAEIALLVERAFEQGLGRPSDVATFVAYGLRYQVDYDRHPQLGVVLSETVARNEPLAPAYRRVGKAVWRELAQSAPLRVQALADRRRGEELGRRYEALEKIGHVRLRARIVNASGKRLQHVYFVPFGSPRGDRQHLGSIDGQMSAEVVAEKDELLSPLPGEKLVLHWAESTPLPSGRTFWTDYESEVSVEGEVPLEDGTGLLELWLGAYDKRVVMYRDEDIWRDAGRSGK
ncbi:DUF4123 domain-containing protein [Paraburkholderia sacchari]|uniref:DUF4123 domain-containing protein n=1 Tax=Paraburkholderia sacchari TaxID=159450 RepID=UPI0039A73D8C